MKFLVWLSILPSLVISLIIYNSYKQEKEPKVELIKAYFMGIISVFITLVLSHLFKVNNMNSDTIINTIIYSFIGISLIEELSKWICTYLFLKNNKNFDYLFDGIVYATFISLGFATIENILYTVTGGVLTGIIRAITTVPAHAFFGISSGYFFSFAKERREKTKKNKYLFLSIFMPFILHGFYDFCLLSKSYIFYIIYIIFVILLYIISIRQVKKMMLLEKAFELDEK